MMKKLLVLLFSVDLLQPTQLWLHAVPSLNPADKDLVGSADVSARKPAIHELNNRTIYQFMFWFRGIEPDLHFSFFFFSGRTASRLQQLEVLAEAWLDLKRRSKNIKTTSCSVTLSLWRWKTME